MVGLIQFTSNSRARNCACSIWKYTELGNVVNVVVAQREISLMPNESQWKLLRFTYNLKEQVCIKRFTVIGKPTAIHWKAHSSIKVYSTGQVCWLVRSQYSKNERL